MFQVQVPIGNLPVNLICLSNGCIAFVRTCEFKTIFDMSSVPAVFFEDCFKIGDTSYEYNATYDYKSHPEMLAWIVAQRLISPV